MIEFIHEISDGEFGTFHLNLNDTKGNKWGDQFGGIDIGARIQIIDQALRTYQTIRHNHSQIWHGSLAQWYRDNKVVLGTRVLVKHSPGVLSDEDLPIIGLHVLQSDSKVQLQSKKKRTNSRSIPKSKKSMPSVHRDKFFEGGVSEITLELRRRSLGLRQKAIKEYGLVPNLWL